MDLIIKIIEIFAFMTGLVYVFLQIRQKNFMWVVGIASGLACGFEFAVQHLWASMGLNIYYVFMSFWGLYSWRKASAKTEMIASETEGDVIHLSHMTRRMLIISAVLFVIGSAILIVILHLLKDSESSLDAIITVLSMIATWWLAKSYRGQWYVWIVSDTLSATMCLLVGMRWMSALYLAYVLSGVYGLHYWKKKGIYIDS
ncbi:MAG: nicotinamide riboside transporter PnuC [Bacteroidales bacterium]|nr:nicotinamide riboside transporter PnuC [Bacteroidales bacterium]